MDYLKISIVTPSFNQADFLEETITSIIDQHYPNLEYIIIDGGSSDRSVDIIKKYQRYLTYWVSEEDGGIGYALNKGFTMSTGEIMGWINSDDKMTPFSLHAIAQVFSEFSNVDWIQGSNAFWNSRGQLLKSKTNTINAIDWLQGNSRWIQQESTFWRRKLWEKAGSHIANKIIMVDSELWSRFFANSELFYLQCILSGYRVHGINRAKIFSELCYQETKQAEIQLSQLADPSITNLANKIKSHLKIFSFFLANSKNHKLLKTLCFLTFGQIFKNTYARAGYNVISWDFSLNRWILARFSFGDPKISRFID